MRGTVAKSLRREKILIEKAGLPVPNKLRVLRRYLPMIHGILEAKKIRDEQFPR